MGLKLYLALGSNVGPSEVILKNAIGLIGERIGPVLKTSPIYRSAPLNHIDNKDLLQPDYLNAVIVCDTELSPQELLKEVNAIEVSLGRAREQELKWGPRPIDIDIIALGDLVLNSKDLRIPHPQFEKRDFVLVPLMAIAPEFIHPRTGTRIKDLVKELEKSGGGLIRGPA